MSTHKVAILKSSVLMFAAGGRGMTKLMLSLFVKSTVGCKACLKSNKLVGRSNSKDLGWISHTVCPVLKLLSWIRCNFSS
jgi:hypothetical protein